MSAVPKALKFLETLVAPGKGTESSEDRPKSFDALLSTNITALTEALAQDSEAQSKLASYEIPNLVSVEDIRWTFSAWNLKILRYLKESMQAAVEVFKQRTDLKSENPSEHTAPPLSPDVLSFGQQKTVLSSLQFIAILGISSNLSPGVGLPVEKRSSFAAGIALKASADTQVRFARLKHCASSLVSCVSLPSLGTLILSRHLGDIFAALAEIGYSPTGKDFDERSHFRGLLDQLLNHVYLPVVVRELILLQGTPPQIKGQSPSPSWLRALCGHLLSRCVMKPNGVKLVLQGILNPTGEANSPDWKKCDAAANVIAHCPRNLVSPEKYYSVISAQVIDLLQVEDKLVAKQFNRVAVTTISTMATLHPEIAEQQIFRPLLHPLLCCTQNRADIPLNSSQSVIVCEKSLATCVDSILKLVTLCDVPCDLLLQQLLPCCHLLFLLLCFTQNGVSHLRGPVEDIVKSYLRHCELKGAVSSIQLMIYGHSSCEKDPQKLMHERLVFAGGDSGGVVVLTGLSQSWLGDWETNAKHLVTLLRKTHRNELSAEFFLTLLQHLTKVISEATESSWMSTTEQVAMETIHRNLLTLTLLGNMCEELGPACLKSVAHIIKFVQATLERAAYIMKNTTDEEFGIFETETMTMAMILLTSVLEDPHQISKEDRASTKSLLPFLEDIAHCHHDKKIREMASDLAIAVATHGRLPSERLKEMAKFEKLAEELRDRDLLGRDDDCSYIKAVEEVKDELIPVKGHGLIALKRLISSKDVMTLQNAEALLEIFRENLRHEDTYVYLAAVQGLAVLADVLADKVLPIVLEEYAETKKRKSDETRMKLGEVLVKTTKALGELTPHHRDVLLQNVLRVTRDTDDHVRASAVSNLGEICRLLRYSLGPVTHEVFECVSSLLKTDASCDVRKSCAMVLTMLLQGLGDDSLKVLDRVLLDVYRLLKQVMNVEKDEGVKLHAMLALAELDIIMKKFLFPEQSLSKHIHVLKPPVA